MIPKAYITTSWDDGHPLDFRVAELLTRYGLTGTFYVPRSADNGTMTPAQVRELSAAFEIGGHTLEHQVLTETTPEKASAQISGCKTWLEDVTGQACTLFCPPKGKFAATHLQMIRQAGFVGVRNVELLSLDLPRTVRHGLQMLPTTLQANPHGFLSYAKNLARRSAFRNFWLLLRHQRTTNWTSLVRPLLARILARGGVFHLWGHSWELENAGQWQRLEEVLRILGDHSDRAPAVTNRQLCQAVAPTEAVTT